MGYCNQSGCSSSLPSSLIDYPTQPTGVMLCSIGGGGRGFEDIILPPPSSDASLNGGGGSSSSK